MTAPKKYTARQVAAAELLWSELRDLFANAERVIVMIIETKAWEPLGYATFAAAWNDRLAGMRLATDCMRAHVAYALFDSGMSVEDVVKATGIGDQSAERLREQREDGVPANLATTRVRAHDRSKPGEVTKLGVVLAPAELASFKDICDARGRDIQQEAVRALRAHFRGLERAPERLAAGRY